jgi:hypothetical protein
MSKKRKKTIRLVFIAVLLLFTYYMNATYVLNFFDSEWPTFIKRFNSPEIYILNRPSPNSLFVFPVVRIISVAIYASLISTLHFALIQTLGNKREAVLFVLASISLLAVSVLLFVSSDMVQDQSNLYFLSRVLKDFVLSPLIIGLFFLLRQTTL